MVLNRELPLLEPTFESLWRSDAPDIDHPNRRGRGWSRVAKIRLQLASGDVKPAYLKRQHHFTTRTWLHPFRGIDTLQREQRMMGMAARSGVGTAEVLFFARQKRQKAVLVVEALSGFKSLDSVEPNVRHRRLIEETAKAVRQMHQAHLCHGCLYPKHIFWSGRKAVIKLIDWEKARRVLLRKSAMLRDLDSLNRRTTEWSLRSRAEFLAVYLNKPINDPQFRRCWQQLKSRAQAKG